MALHPNLESMLQESLVEMLLVAKYCIEYKKDILIWSSQGCYGYPAALLLLSVVDCIGSYVTQKGEVKQHFKVLNDPKYYGLNLGEDEINILFDHYRNSLSHNAVLSTKVQLDIGKAEDEVFIFTNNQYKLNLVPFYNLSVKSVKTFLNDPAILFNNKTLKNIYLKT